MKMRILFLVGIFVLTLGFQSKAQDYSTIPDAPFQYNSWSLTGGFGMGEFYGDVSRAVFYPGSVKDGNFSWAGYLSGKKYLTPYFGLSATIGYSKLWSEWRPDQGFYLHPGPLWFEAGIFDYDLSGEINLTTLFWPKVYEKKWSVYGVLGIGSSHYRSILYDADDVFVNSVGYSSNGTVKETPKGEAIITSGLGFKYRINNMWAVGLEGMIKSLPSDMLDGVIKEITENDKYGYTAIEIEYNFGKQTDYVPLEFNPIPWEDLWLRKKLAELEHSVDSVKDVIENDIDPKLDDLVDWKTKELADDDGDNVPNYKDLEPNTEAGAQTDTHGRTIIIPEPENIINPDKLLQWQSVYFALDKTYLTQASYQRIANVASIMNEYPDLKVEIDGNTCRLASDDYNMKLSQERAEAVKKALVEKFGIDAARLSIVSYGETKPMSKDLLYINRRVDFRIAK